MPSTQQQQSQSQPQPPQQDASSSAYRITSLEFINLPNPIQPVPQFQKHPLNGTPRLGKSRLEDAPKQDLFNFILDPNTERPSKRQKATENPHLDLPKLPVRNNAKRLRIPPTLSGLHQPPPDAGLLPSISVEQPPVPPPRARDKQTSEPSTSQDKASERPSEPEPVATPDKPSNTTGAADPPQQRRNKRNKWSDEETECLLKGVARFGIGNWTKILNCPDYRFNNRTALDLKDRFRVCCPEHYQRQKHAASASKHRRKDSEDENHSKGDKKATKGPAPERVSPSTLKKLGINQPFTKSERRSRHGYTADEDSALLQGFQKYGKSWASIRQDPSLGLSARQPTDLRDRMRTRFPDEYASAGLAPRSEKPPPASKRPVVDSTERPPGVDEDKSKDPGPITAKPTSAPTTVEEESLKQKPSEVRRPHQPSLFSLDDVFLGRPFGQEGDDDADNEPIVLDRGILDWATGESSRLGPMDNSKSNGINPLVTLNLPKPMPPILAPASSVPQQLPANTSLPSLASLLPESTHSEQTELPPFAEWFGPLEQDGRTGGNNFPTLEEILSQPIEL